MTDEDSQDDGAGKRAEQRDGRQGDAQGLVVGEELHCFRDTFVMLGIGPGVLWTADALCRV